MDNRISDSLLQDWQKRVQQDIPERFHYARLLSILALQEEVGELAAELAEAGSSSPASANASLEFGDVLLSCLEVANAYGLTLRAPVNPPASSGGLLHLCIAVCEVSRECLEVEGFERQRRGELHQALQSVVESLAAIASFYGIDPVASFEQKLGQILDLIADGTWDRRYKDLLLTKKRKLD